MKIVFDQGTPAPLRQALTGHSVSTAFELGWADLENGELLRRAAKEFDLLITTDQNLRHQQDLTKFQLAVLVLPTTSWRGFDSKSLAWWLPSKKPARASIGRSPSHRAHRQVPILKE